MRQKLMRTIETCVFSGRHGASKVVSVPIDNDCGEQIETCHTVVLSLGGSVTDFALTADAQSVLQGMMRLALAKAVFAHSQGRIMDRTDAAQQKRAMALNLVIAAIIYWNSIYIEKAADHLRQSGRLSEPGLLKHASPLGWEHINLSGDFDWHSGAAERSNARPLHLSAARREAG